MTKQIDCLPDFLGIGAPRSGTTWLYHNLGKHPDIWMPPEKELHYFDRSLEYNSPNRLASDSPLQRIFGWQKQNKEFRLVLAKAFISGLYKLDAKALRWNFRYFFSTCNDEWYASLFEQGRHKVKGEITPAYSLLKPQDVEHIRELMPNLKIIYLLRNPINRDWSSLRKNDRSALPLEKLVKNNEYTATLRADYIRTISTWRNYFPEEQIFIGFFEEIEQNPQRLLMRLYEFLGIEPTEKHVQRTAYQQFGSSPPKDMPEDLKVYMTRKYIEQIRGLSNLVGGHASQWLEDAEATLRDAEPVNGEQPLRPTQSI